MVLVDRYGRPLTNIRLAVTSLCNFRCFFCHMEGLESVTPQHADIRYVEALATAARRLGVESFKLTGGEPLLHPRIVDVVHVIRSLGMKVSITTNGYYLADYASKLAEEGVDHINVSLHSLHREVFRKITGVDALEKVVEGVKAASSLGLRVKLNFVVLRGLNEQELDKLIEFASRYAYRLQVIELHPVGKGGDVFSEYHVPDTEVIRKLAKRCSRVRVRRDLHNRPILVLDNGLEVEIVGPVGNWSFCAACTRIRAGPDGTLIPCLNWDGPPVSVSGCMSLPSFEDMVECVAEGLRKVNTLRRPSYLPCIEKTPRLTRRIRSMRLGLPKPSGALHYTKSRRDHFKLYLEEFR